MKRLILMAVIICLSTGLASQAQVNKKRIERGQTPERVDAKSSQVIEKNQRGLKQSKKSEQSKEQVVRTDKKIKENSADDAKKNAYRKYRVATRKAEKAQAKVDAANRKIEKLEQDLANERISVAEKITSGNGLTREEATALEKALQVVDEKYGSKIAAARTELNNAMIDLEHAKSYLEDAEMEYKRYQ